MKNLVGLMFIVTLIACEPKIFPNEISPECDIEKSFLTKLVGQNSSANEKNNDLPVYDKTEQIDYALSTLHTTETFRNSKNQMMENVFGNKNFSALADGRNNAECGTTLNRYQTLKILLNSKNKLNQKQTLSLNQILNIFYNKPEVSIITLLLKLQIWKQENEFAKNSKTKLMEILKIESELKSKIQDLKMGLVISESEKEELSNKAGISPKRFEEIGNKVHDAFLKIEWPIVKSNNTRFLKIIQTQ